VTGNADTQRPSLIIGGPFYGLLKGLKLLGADQLPAGRAGVVLAALAWLLPAALAVLQDVATGDAIGLGFFSDPSVPARFLVGIFVCIAIERQAETRLSLILDNFRNAQLIKDRDLPILMAALETADRRTSSPLPEAIVLAIALILSGFVFAYGIRIDPSAWEGRVVDGAVTLSWAGLAARWVSAPLFQFLVLRWLWRFVAWSYLLFRISRLPLQLSVMHPDRMGGLSFVSLYPPVFNGLTFAVSSAIAAAFIRDLGVETISLQTVQILVAAWIGISVVLMVGPLLVFTPRLMELKDGAVVRYGRLAGELHRAFERKWLDGEGEGGSLLTSADASAAADTNAIVGAIWGLRVVPIELPTVMSVALAAGVPMLAVLATQMPLDQLAKTLMGALL
jgi:hypothetical protein